MPIKYLLLLSALLSTTIAYAQLADKFGASFAQPGRLIDVHGHRLNLRCSGTGSPTVVFDAPSGEAGWTWWAVQPKVASTTRACVYDRAGIGFSDPAKHAATSANVVDDLHALLTVAGENPPYVLVGNSLGGANVQLYAYRYPAEVKGLVLVEPMHEDEQARIGKASQGKVAEIDAQMREGAKACMTQSEMGFLDKIEMLKVCTGGLEAPYRGSLAAARIATRLRPQFWRAGMSEQEAFELDHEQLRAARRPFGDLPLVVLVRGVSPYSDPSKPQSALAKAVEAENLAMNAQVARLSTRGEYRVVVGAGHNIQDDRPGAVIKAVGDVLAAIKR